ncbi:MAG: insulinase family protein [Gemmatimonadetes bacterium]|nr:insulinase family protein [Gemmatimonadota bacterium]
MSGARGIVAAVLGGVSAALLAAGGAAAQGAGRAPGVTVLSRPAATLVVATVVIPTGSSDDPEGTPGTARLVAEGIASTVRWRLDPDAARVDLRVDRDWTAFTLLASPDVWVASWGVLEDVLFRAPLVGAPLEAARAQLLQSFGFETGAPVIEFERELYMTIGGASSPWSRDPRGTPASLSEADAGELEAFRAAHYQMARATAAVVGPVSDAAARAALAPVGAGPLPEPAAEDDRLAWRRGERIPLEREVTNTWIGALYPAPSELPRTRLEFLAHEVQEALSPSPPDPGLFSVSVRIEDAPRGQVMVVDAAVMPEAAATWERRILATVRGLEREATDGYFGFHRRRFRNDMLVREGQPEEAALRMALDLQREGRVRPLQDEIWEIGPHELAEAAQDLGEPRVLIMGPEIADPGGR